MRTKISRGFGSFEAAAIQQIEAGEGGRRGGGGGGHLYNLDAAVYVSLVN